MVIVHLFTEFPSFQVGLLYFRHRLSLVGGVRQGEENVQVQLMPHPGMGSR
jgi:hypothetical protein